MGLSRIVNNERINVTVLDLITLIANTQSLTKLSQELEVTGRNIFQNSSWTQIISTTNEKGS